jgi:hypothetical protein
MTTWFNADGLRIKHGRENKRENSFVVKSVKTFGTETELVIDFDLASAPAGTQFTTDRNNDGTKDGFFLGDVHLPNGALPTSAVLIMTDEAAAGGTSLTLGAYQLDGTVIDADGFITAANASTANMSANADVTGTGADLGVAVTQDTYLGITTAGTFTAGKGSIVVKYTLIRKPE